MFKFNGEQYEGKVDIIKETVGGICVCCADKDYTFDVEPSKLHINVYGGVGTAHCIRLFCEDILSTLEATRSMSGKSILVHNGDPEGVLDVWDDVEKIQVEDASVAVSGEVMSAKAIDYMISGDDCSGVINNVGFEYDKQSVFRKLTDNAKMPAYGTKDSAGADFFCSETCVVEPHKTCLVHTGVGSLLRRGTAMFIMARSSMPKRGLMLANSVGLIDSD